MTKRTNLVLHRRVLPSSIETFFVNSDQKRRSSKIYCSTEFSVQLRDFATVLDWVPGSSLDYHYDDENDDHDDDENDGDDDDDVYH